MTRGGGVPDSTQGAPLTPGLPVPGPAAALPVLQNSGRLRRLLQLRYETLHVIEYVVEDVLWDRAGHPETPESRTLITPVEAPRSRALRHIPQPQTKPHPLMEDSYPPASPAPSLAPPLNIWPRPTHHVPLRLQTRQFWAAGAQVRGGRVSAAGGLRPAGPPRRFCLGDGLRLGSHAARGRLYRANRCADRRAALQGRSLSGGRRAALQLLLRGPTEGEGETEAKGEETEDQNQKKEGPEEEAHLCEGYTQNLKQALFDSIENSFSSTLVVSVHFSDGETEAQRPHRPLVSSASSPASLPERRRPAIPTARTIVVQSPLDVLSDQLRLSITPSGHAPPHPLPHLAALLMDSLTTPVTSHSVNPHRSTP